MRSILSKFILFSFLLALIVPDFTSAEIKTFIKEYTYQASEDDSRNSSRILALREVKRLLLEELGIYLESVTEVQNFQFSKDQITTFTAGIVKTEIVDEKWDGLTYWLKSKIVADSDEVIKSINVLRKDRVKTKELESVKKLSNELLRENVRLRKELLGTTGEERQRYIVAYNDTINDLTAIDWYELGSSYRRSDNKKEAMDAFNNAIDMNPKFADAYHSRGSLYRLDGNYNQAIKDYDKVIEINPKDADVYIDRGGTYVKLGKYKQAIKDYDKSIELNPDYLDYYYFNRADVYIELGNYKQAIKDFDKAIELRKKMRGEESCDSYSDRGIAYALLGNHKQAIKNYNKAIEINPLCPDVFLFRGSAYSILHKYLQAVKDFNKAIEIDPQVPNSYYERGLTYQKLGNHKQAIKDYKIAARLGFKDAQDNLRKQRITW
jgi:tetratricopeptide (TPR) repeat protein